MECALKPQTADFFKYVLICACVYPNSVHDVQCNGNKYIPFGSVPHKAWRAFAASVEDYCYWNENWPFTDLLVGWNWFLPKIIMEIHPTAQ